MSGYYSDVLPAHDKVTIRMRFHNDNVMGGTLTLAGRTAAGTPHWLARSLFVDTKRVFDC